MTRRVRATIVAAAFMAASAPWRATAASTPAAPPSAVAAAAFFREPQMSDPVISPDGSALAILVRGKSGRRQLAVLDTGDLSKATIAASFDDADVAQVEWVNARRLLFHTWHEEVSAGDQRGSGVYAVDRDGGALRALIRAEWEQVRQAGSMIKVRTLDADNAVVRTLDDGSDEIIVEHILHSSPVAETQHFHIEVTGTTPMRLDTRTGLTRDAVEGRPPDHVFRWVFDEKGRLVVAETQDAGVQTLLVKGESGWTERARFDAYGKTPDAFEVLGRAANGKVYGTQALPGPDATAALFELDPTTFRPGPAPLVALKGFDYAGDLIEDSSNGKLLGIHYVSDGKGTVWFDAAMKALQAKVDARLPGLINTLDPAQCGCAKRVLVTSESDHQPPLFFLYDRGDDTLLPIGSARPDIDPRQMADTDFVRIQARDGHDLPLYVTKPHGKGPWPTVVLVHGGPALRGWDWRWEPEPQFLASRGYLVVAPEFRGSDGYGLTLLKSGFRQWGLSSQDDIADATTWAARQGLADPERTCIAGASYGGYATLMGLVRYGNLYRCGVAWAAVADIGMMYDLWWSDAPDQWRGYGMPVMVGDPIKDAAQFEATSPLKQAARIQRPLLLAHGGLDRRVPVEQARALRAALEAHHAPLTWILYPAEAHGWYDPETRIGFYEQMQKFLDANIGARATAPDPGGSK